MRSPCPAAPAAPHSFVLPEIAAALDLLSQCRDFLRALPDGLYAAPSNLIPGGTIGKHLRHLLDHYFAILDFAESGREGATLDYDHRERDTATETSVLVGIAMLERAATRLAATEDDALPLRVHVASMLAADGTEAQHRSTLGRELAFATHHGLHHAAMIGAIGREHGLAVDPNFGKAPATLAHERAMVRAAARSA